VLEILRVLRTMAEEKIQLILRNAGITSRRGSEQLIKEGRVTISGRVVESPVERADPDRDHIKVDGKLLRLKEFERRFFAFNKPRFVVSTMNDPEGRPALGDLVRKLGKPIFSVGRLDFDAEGLMILTNDGDAAHSLSHPSFRIPRTYLVKVRGVPESRDLGRIRKGMLLGEGDRLGQVEWKVTKIQAATTWLRLTLYEGKKNEIKRIFFRIGHPVRKIRRISFGPISLGDLATGKWRPLRDSEREMLLASTNSEA